MVASHMKLQATWHSTAVGARELASGRWPGILAALGVDQAFLQNKHGPCPMCGGVDRFRFDDRQGRGGWICSHCGAGDGFKLLGALFGWNFKRAADEIERVAATVPVITTVPARSSNEQPSDAQKLAAIERTLKQSRKVMPGDPVWRYLHSRCGIEQVPADIRFHPGLRHSSGGIYPAMLAVMRDAAGAGVSVHRTYLTEAGDKAAVEGVKKFMQGRPLNGAAVRLDFDQRREGEPGAGEQGARCIGIAEGIETALCAARRFDLPVWAATNAVLLECWAPPSSVRSVLICADNDSSYTGQAAAYALAKRLVREGLRVRVAMPDQPDTDFADMS